MINSEFGGAEISEWEHRIAEKDNNIENTDNRSDLTLPALLFWTMVP